MIKFRKAAIKSIDIIKDQGIVSFSKKVVKHSYYRTFPKNKKINSCDILFVNGCSLAHPVRYRVDHQREQLRAAGVSTEVVYFEQLDTDLINYYKGFVFYRCPITDTVSDFIKEAKKRNKTCFFDIDDLVIDTKYTNDIKYVASMNKSDKMLYDDGVNRMRETLTMCDYATVSTDTLREELSNYVNDVYVNRNVASDEMVACSLYAREQYNSNEDKKTFTIGYFSGSITHNDDFEIVIPHLIKLFDKYDNFRLKVGGILDIPTELLPYSDRISATGFIDWRKLPSEIVQCDVNIVPMVSNIFNRAKSENKWLEAALVNVPTIATDIGAFKHAITDGVDGVLINNNDWYKSIEKLMFDRKLTSTIGDNAKEKALNTHTTIGTSGGIAEYITSRLSRSIAFVIPTSDISGGVNVVLKHADILLGTGWDVTIIDAVDRRALKKSIKKYDYRTKIPGHSMFIKHKTNMKTHYDVMVATLWTTLDEVKNYPNTKRRMYLVQGFETDFYQWGGGLAKFDANATYFDRTGVEYITISPWCKTWLKDEYGKDAGYAPNGIDLSHYPCHERKFKGRIKILIEGDSHNKTKNTDEAFRIVEKLDRKKYHISYLSYRKSPKRWYIVDKFYNRIQPEDVGRVYADCDILIKTSLLESFSYPPLEMLATGGYVVAIHNEGNKTYLKNGENCLIYKHGDIDAGVAAVENIVADNNLRKELYSNGKKTAEEYSWSRVEALISSLYE